MATELSDRQRQALHPGVRLIEACPGAGKTRTIVERFVSIAERSPYGVALISFTNAAVDEAISRCRTDIRLTEPPNFVGTFDRFIHRFLVTPVVIRELGRTPRYVDSWADLTDSAKVRHRDVPGGGVSLASFRTDIDGRLTYPDETPAIDRAYAAQLGRASLTPTDLTSQAERLVKRLVDAGTYDSDQSRIRAQTILADPGYQWLHTRLKARFEEVIIDEFQDCSAVDHKIIGGLQRLGIRVVAVADPDQAIYEFRFASPISYSEYKQRLSAGQIVSLDENYRSSPAICAVVSSLRSIGGGAIHSRRDSSAESPHADVVYVVSGSHEFARAQFDRIAASLGITLSERLVLASTRKAAIALAGGVDGGTEPTKLTPRVVRNIATLRNSTNAGARRDALSSLESVILDSLKFSDDLARASKADKLAAAGIEQAQLRVIIADLVTRSNSWANAADATESIRTIIGNVDSSVQLPLRATPAVRFKALGADDWRKWSLALATPRHATGIASAHIHSVKGREFDAVLLEIEEAAKGDRAHVIDLWISGHTHEARRVLYVGASRARRLLMLATPPAHLDTLRGHLDSEDLPVEYIEGGAKPNAHTIP